MKENKDTIIKHKSSNHFRSTSMNSGPFSLKQNNNNLNNINLFPNSLAHLAKSVKFNPHNNEILSKFRRKSTSVRFQNEDGFKTFQKNLKNIENSTEKDKFLKSQTKKTFYLNRTNKNYDGFDGYSIPKVKERCATAKLNVNDTNNLYYNKNYEKLLNTLICKNKQEEEEKNLEKLCEKENNKLKSIIKCQIKFPILQMESKVSEIHVGPKIIFGKDHIKKEASKTVQQKQLVETTHVPHVEGNTFVTTLNRNNHT